MCLPIIAAVVAVAGVVEGAVAQNKAHAANKAAALKAEMQAITDLNAREVENTVAAINQKDAASRQAKSVIGSEVTGAAESGVGGQSISAILHGIDADLGSYTNRVDTNLATAQRQAEREKKSAQITAESRIAAVPAADGLATGIGIAGAVIGAYANYKYANPFSSSAEISAGGGATAPTVTTDDSYVQHGNIY